MKTADVTNSLWVDSWRVHVGQDFHGEIQQALHSASFGLVLLSPAFLASRYIKEHELPHLLGKDKILPVQLCLTSSHHDMRGIQSKQIFALENDTERLPFSQCDERQRELFVVGLFEQIQTRINKAKKS